MNGKRVMKTKQPVALVALLVLLCCTVAGTLAYLVTSTDPVTNTFTPAEVKTEVTESFENDKNGTLTKSNVQIKNNGNIDAYIRVAVVVNWADKDGNVYGGAVPTDKGDKKDYDLTLKANNGWIKGADGYYYYIHPVAPKESTTAIFEDITQLTDDPAEGYGLQITILADGIQSEPGTTVVSVWKSVTDVNTDKTLSVATN